MWHLLAAGCNLVHYIALHCITLQYSTSHYITLHYSTLHYITLHYCIATHITLHCIRRNNELGYPTLVFAFTDCDQVCKTLSVVICTHADADTYYWGVDETLNEAKIVNGRTTLIAFTQNDLGKPEVNAVRSHPQTTDAMALTCWYVM